MIDRIPGLGGDGISDQMSYLKESALDATATAREKLSQGAVFVRNFTVREPVKALGVALGMGVMLGWLIKRR